MSFLEHLLFKKSIQMILESDIFFVKGVRSPYVEPTAEVVPVAEVLLEGAGLQAHLPVVDEEHAVPGRVLPGDHVPLQEHLVGTLLEATGDVDVRGIISWFIRVQLEVRSEFNYQSSTRSPVRVQLSEFN